MYHIRKIHTPRYTYLSYVARREVIHVTNKNKHIITSVHDMLYVELFVSGIHVVFYYAKG